MAFLIVMACLSLLTLLIYTPAIIQWFKWKKAEREFHKQLALLESSGLYDECRIVETRPLGTGPVPAGTLRFADVHHNQEFAVATVLQLI